MKKNWLLLLLVLAGGGCAKINGSTHPEITGSGFKSTAFSSGLAVSGTMQLNVSSASYGTAIGSASYGSSTSASYANSSASYGSSASASYASYPNPTPTPPTLVKKVRVQKESDGQTYLEYLDPNSSTTQSWIQFGKVTQMPKGTQLHHWGPKDDVRAWAKDGISEADIDRSRDNIDDSDMMGGGFYLSTDPLDSAEFGPNCLVAELTEPITVFTGSLYYNKTLNTYDYARPAGPASIPPHLVAEAGIDAIQYGGNWMVAVTAKPVKKLFEANWENFAEHYGSTGLTSSFLAKLNGFAAHYPLTKTDAKSTIFKKNLPAIAAYLNSGTVPTDQVSALANEVLESSEYELPWNSYNNGTAGVLDGFYKLIQDQIVKEVPSAFVNTKDDPDKQRVLISKLYYLKISLSDVSGFRSIEPRIADTSGANFLDDYFSPTRMSAVTALSVGDYYEQLNSLISKKSTVDAVVSQYTNAINAAYYMWPFDALKTAQLWDPKASYRDLPANLTGPNLLDGPNSDGYIAVSNDEKDSLEKDLYLVSTFKSKKDKAGNINWFVKLEFPSVRTYKKFLSLLPQDLQSNLASADQAGKLKDATSADARDLTSKIVAAIAANDNGDLSYLAKLQPFSDKQITRFVLSKVAANNYAHPLLLPTQDLLILASQDELLELSYNNRTNQYIYDKFIVDPKKPRDMNADFDFDLDVGIWEIAAANYAPKNEAAFVAAVKKRFLQPDVQKWIREEKDLFVFEALQKAGEGL